MVHSFPCALMGRFSTELDVRNNLRVADTSSMLAFRNKPLHAMCITGRNTRREILNYNLNTAILCYTTVCLIQ